MAITAVTEPGTHLFTENQVFDFGDDGKRQVTGPEKQVLERYVANGGALKIEFQEPKSKAKE